MTSVQDSLARLAGSRIFSAVDMQGAFHSIEMDERDREKTAFATPFGSFQQKMLGFGVTNGPPTYRVRIKNWQNHRFNFIKISKENQRS